MHVCPFCAYINGISKIKPNIECYNDTLELKYIDTSGAHITRGVALLTHGVALLNHDYKVIPRNDSCFFDKTEMIITDQETKDSMKFWINKLLCDSCLMNLYLNNKLIIVSELSENEKLFRIYLRGLKN